MNSEEQFWQGEFGDNYTARNINFVENNYRMFRKVFFKGEYLNVFKYKICHSIIEFGAGSGQNILALQKIFPYPYCDYYAIEINNNAYNKLRENTKNVCCIKGSIFDYFFDFSITGKVNADLVLSKGILIHIHPDNIQKAYEVLYKASNKYILICEYYNPVPVDVMYRDNRNKLWKRDFAGEMMDKYTDLKLLDYGFCYHRDEFPQDDLTWFLMEKK